MTAPISRPGRDWGRPRGELPRLSVRRVLGLFMGLFALTQLPPLLVSLWFRDGEATHFLDAAALMTLMSVVLWHLGARTRPLRTRDGFLVVAAFWLVLGPTGALPLWLSGALSPIDALFETVSGLTTTGATVLDHLDSLPPSLLYYRQQLNWLGGAGVIVLGVAVLPLLGLGGLQLYKAETPGPFKDDRLTPRIAHTARSLWLIYLTLTVLCALAYWLGGMSAFDAVAHSFSTVSTGGFSTHDAGLGYYDLPLLEVIGQVFMLLGAINFSVHFLAWRRGHPGAYFTDVEVRGFLVFTFAVVLIVSAGLWLSGQEADPLQALRLGSFQVVSVITSTGLTTDNFSLWPLGLPLLLIFTSFVGGCAGSTAGGMKVIRVLLLGRQTLREILRLIHPTAVVPLKLGDKVVPESVHSAVWGYFGAYVVSFAVLMLAMVATGEDQVSAFAAIATCLNNLGPGLGDVATSFQSVPPAGKLVGVAAMLLGRLEIFTLLVLLTPAFWRS